MCVRHASEPRHCRVRVRSASDAATSSKKAVSVHPCSYGIMQPFELEPGKYDRVFTASEVANFLLSQSDRDRISGCSLKEYDSLSMSDDQKRMMIRSEENLSVYIKEKHPEWEIKKGRLVSGRAEEESLKDCKVMQLISQALSYVRDLDITDTWGEVKDT